jgi:hypothetical protein
MLRSLLLLLAASPLLFVLPLAWVWLASATVAWHFTFTRKYRTGPAFPSRKRFEQGLRAPPDQPRVDDICAFCRDRFTDPVELPCKHVYCRGCLRTLLQSGTLRCPYCSRQFCSDQDDEPWQIMLLPALRTTAWAGLTMAVCGVCVTLHLPQHTPGDCEAAIIIATTIPIALNLVQTPRLIPSEAPAASVWAAAPSATWLMFHSLFLHSETECSPVMDCIGLVSSTAWLNVLTVLLALAAWSASVITGRRDWWKILGYSTAFAVGILLQVWILDIMFLFRWWRLEGSPSTQE